MSTITYDWPTDAGPPPGPGDVLVCLSRRHHRPTGTFYAILAAHEVQRIEPVPGESRHVYTVERVAAFDPERTRFEALTWYPRGRRR